MPSATFQPAKLAKAIAAPSTGSEQTKPSSEHLHRTFEQPSITQLIDAREVLRILTLHLLGGSLKTNEAKRKYINATLAHLHYGGLLTNMGHKDASGVIQPAYSGNEVFVRSLWLSSSRDAQGQYWRAYEINGYKSQPFPQTPESRLVWQCLIEFVRKQDQEPLGQHGLEFVDIAIEIISRGPVASSSPVLLLTSNRQALSLVGAVGYQIAKVALRENAGQRVMQVMDAYGWLTSKIEKASKGIQQCFLDMSLPAFKANPEMYLARWEVLKQLGIREFKRRSQKSREELHTMLELFNPWWALSNPHYPNNTDDCVSKVAEYLHEHKSITAQQLAALQKYIIGTGQGQAIAPVKLPLSIGLFKS